MKKLRKSITNRNLFGVCAGLGEYLGIDITLIRILFVLGSIFSGSVVFWIYIILALVLPNEEKV